MFARGSAMISVCLVDDQNLVRQGVRSLLDLSEDIRVVAECADGAQAVQDIPRIKPDVVLLDLRMPNMSGLEVLQALRSEEHTSELQSLMRISYAVFCLKKKKNKKHILT